MTLLSESIRNYLVQDTELMNLVGKSTNWLDGWIFSDNIYATIEGTSRVAIVITEDGTWSASNGHNSLRFPRVIIDVWADPTRNSDGSVQVPDAKNKIEAVSKILFRDLHTINKSKTNGDTIVWGTAAQITAKTGSIIIDSEQNSGPNYRPIQDVDGGYMGTLTFHVQTSN